MSERFAYAAGIIDGEGSVLLTRHHRRESRRPTVTVTNTCREMLDFLSGEFGGHISKKRTVEAHHKQAWMWSLSGDASIRFLAEVYPRMIDPVKVGRARMIVEEYKSVTPRNGKYTPEMMAARADFDERFFAIGRAS